MTDSQYSQYVVFDTSPFIFAVWMNWVDISVPPSTNFLSSAAANLSKRRGSVPNMTKLPLVNITSSPAFTFDSATPHVSVEFRVDHVTTKVCPFSAQLKTFIRRHCSDIWSEFITRCAKSHLQLKGEPVADEQKSTSPPSPFVITSQIEHILLKGTCSERLKLL